MWGAVMTIVRRPAQALAAIGLATATVTAALAAGSIPGGAQAAAPQATVDPADGLVDGSRVTVSVTGLPAGASVEVAQCAAGSSASFESCDLFDSKSGTADGSGTAGFELGVDAVMAVGDFEAPDELDCRTDGACVILVFPGFDAQGFPPIEVPLGFDPG